MEFTDAKHIARLTSKQIADYLKLSPATIKRYEKTGKAPKAVTECLLMIGGLCPTWSLRADFGGWSFGGGFLWSPAGEKFTSGDVLAIIYDKQRLKVMERDLTRHKKRAWLKSDKDRDLLFRKVSAEIIQFPANRKKRA